MRRLPAALSVTVYLPPETSSLIQQVTSFTDNVFIIVMALATSGSVALLVMGQEKPYQKHFLDHKKCPDKYICWLILSFCYEILAVKCEKFQCH